MDDEIEIEIKNKIFEAGLVGALTWKEVAELINCKTLESLIDKALELYLLEIIN